MPHCTRRNAIRWPCDSGSRAKVGTKRRKMYKDIEDLVSEATTARISFDKMYRNRSLGQKVMDKMRDTAEESESRYLDRKPVQTSVTVVRVMKNGGCVMSGRGPKYKDRVITSSPCGGTVKIKTSKDESFTQRWANLYV